MINNMECHTCGYIGDDVQDFISTEEIGERLCPRCGSQECFIISECIDEEPESFRGPLHNASEEAIEKWAERYDELNGAPENDEDC